MKAEMKQVALWLQPEEIHLDVDLRDANHALAFIAGAIAELHELDPAPIYRALSRREQAGSTALGAGFAVPHACILGITRPLTFLVRARHPIEFKAPDHEPVSLMLAILVPDQGDRDDHLRLLALVAELFSSPHLRTRMDRSAHPAELAESLRESIARLEGRTSVGAASRPAATRYGTNR